MFNTAALILRLQGLGYTPVISKTVLRSIDVEAFVKEHGEAYTNSFSEHAIIKISVSKDIVYYLFYHMFTGRHSYAGFACNAENWEPVEDAFQASCEELNPSRKI